MYNEKDKPEKPERRKETRLRRSVIGKDEQKARRLRRYGKESVMVPRKKERIT